MRAVVVIEIHAKGSEIALVARLDIADEVFRRDTGLLGGQHDRCAVRIIGADEPRLATLHALRANPDVGLDIADQMAEMQVAIGIGQSAGHQQFGLISHEGDGRCGKVGDYPTRSARALKLGARLLNLHPKVASSHVVVDHADRLHERVHRCWPHEGPTALLQRLR
jgi:hypothetical protein